MQRSKIEWTDLTWNPITGCSPISEGCQNCYAAKMAKRLAGRFGYPEGDGFKPTFHEDKLDEPLKRKKPSRIFVCSMGDLFHESVSIEWQQRVYAAMMEAPQHRFMVLTKRPERMRDLYQRWLALRAVATRIGSSSIDHIWLGVSAENQQRADERIPILLDIPAAKRFVSIEPMLGPIDLGLLDSLLPIPNWANHYQICERLHWVIVGGETGHNARPLHPDWACGIRDQCQNVGIPFFFKGFGKHIFGRQWKFSKVGINKLGRLLDGREWNEVPK